MQTLSPYCDLAWCPLAVSWPGLLNYASAQWRATPSITYKHTPKSSTPSCTLHCSTVLAFSSKDKGSWRLACWDLIAEAHFTLPKPGLIHLSTLVPLLTETCFCLRCSTTGFFSPHLEKKEKEKAEGEGKCFSFFCLILFNFSFQGADHVFHLELHKDQAFFFVFSHYCFWPSGDFTYFSANMFYSNTTPKPRLKHKENTDGRTTVI